MRRACAFLLSLGFLVGGISLSSRMVEAADDPPALFVAHMKDGEKTIEGVLRMRFSRTLSGYTEFGVIQIDFASIATIVPIDNARKIMVTMKTGESAKVELTNSLYMVNAIYGRVDLSLQKIKKIAAKE